MRARVHGPLWHLDCPSCGVGSGTLTPGRLHEQAAPSMLCCAACGTVLEEPTSHAFKLAEDRERAWQIEQAKASISEILAAGGRGVRAALFKAWPGEQHVRYQTWRRLCREAQGLKSKRRAKVAQLALPGAA